MNFLVTNWYWKDSTGRIFSSAARALIEPSDPTYAAWLKTGNLPTPWPKDDSGAQTDAALDEVLAPYGLSTGLVAPSLNALKVALVSAASSACSAITGQIVPDVTHQNAYLNAAALVGSSGAPPSTDPAKTVFANMATAFDMQPAAFASLVVSVQLASMQLSTILSTLEGAVQSATSASALSTALASFQSAVAAFVTTLNAQGLTIQVSAPPAITIPGVNA